MVVVSSLAIMIVVIYLLAIVTDEFFIESLDQIAKRLKLSNDVAGASLMAMGSSAPELAIAILALFSHGGEHSDLGIGTIMGSAVFNILVIAGASAIAQPANITWRVVTRDVTMYIASIAALLATFSDGTINILEALLFLVLYCVYIVTLMNWEAFDPNEPQHDIESAPVVKSGNPSIFKKLNAVLSRLIGYITGDAAENYARTFIVSVILIAALSYALVEHALIFSDALGIPPLIVALTILAAGTSVPDLIASILVARQGRGEMAVANAIGSNIFDILIGLGIPWILAIVINGGEISVGTAGLWTSAIILLSTVIVLFLFLTTNRRLDRWEGWVLISGYGVFIIYTVLSG